MPPKKRKLVEEEEEKPVTKYAAGKQPRNGVLPEVVYNHPMYPESELHQEMWTIPKFNLFISFTLNYLIESYKAMFKDFIKLPSRKFHPQYYYKIQQPISINEIKSRDYEFPDGPHTFLLDIELLAKNCISYNEPDSLIVKNSLQVVQYIEYEVLKAKNVTRNYLVSDDVKYRLLTYLKRVINATDKNIEEEMGVVHSNTDDVMKIAEPFMQLVDRDELPDYYEVIHRPTALGLIRQNLEVGYYSKIYDFIVDTQATFQNALVFNDLDTLIYQDAKKLLGYFNHLMQHKFFPELQDASERGETKLEYDKIEYEQYLADGGNENTNELLEDDDLTDYDFNHIEGLGNGYNRTILSEDYLLGPNATESQSKKPMLSTPIEEPPKILKYNIIKSMQKELISQEHTIEKVPYDMIDQVSIFSSKSLYHQATNPGPGAKPSCNQNWVAYTFNGAQMNQNENMYSFNLQPVQTFLTLTAKIRHAGLESSLMVNSENIKSLKVSTDAMKQEDGQQLEQNEEKEVIKNDSERFDIRLNEGLNYIVFKCQNSDKEKIEFMKFWVNVLP
ncbi:hypothetical protein HG535_0D03810 [Zygotorulaspora mrakii]|uniref:Bromo domain-containing protein n=1 Tax=Zygotorulaspora mrakii TaxID=42260 RepID=A0A7H9B2F7_ZYGMR|nr:uncharacterized protein HG535_0D03810 [Zygotorulaspora mrakii]QLG72673.1 hypothetical protein HG535_0D03810 [Zygotorulaspora mrakii]